MEQFTERAFTYDECLNKIQAKYGERARVVTRTSVMMGGFLGFGMKAGVELSGYVPNTYGINPAGVISYQGNNGGLNVQAMASGGNTGSAQAAPRVKPGAIPEPASRNELASRSEPLIFEEEKKKILANTGNSALPTILKELQDIKEKLEVASTAAANSAAEDHPNLGRLEELLAMNDFSSAYQAGILERVRKECPLETLEDFDVLQDKALEWIGETISLY
jgi:flagellar biosynthesis protein FlhF